MSVAFKNNISSVIKQELDAVRVELADFFCEDRDAFKLEECFKLFLGFCQRFRQGVMENEHRRQQEAAADARRKQREEQLALKRRQSSSTNTKYFYIDCIINVGVTYMPYVFVSFVCCFIN